MQCNLVLIAVAWRLVSYACFLLPIHSRTQHTKMISIKGYISVYVDKEHDASLNFRCEITPCACFTHVIQCNSIHMGTLTNNIEEVNVTSGIHHRGKKDLYIFENTYCIQLNNWLTKYTQVDRVFITRHCQWRPRMVLRWFPFAFLRLLVIFIFSSPALNTEKGEVSC